MRNFIITLPVALVLGTAGFAGEMSSMDQNADGVLSVEEFAAGYTNADPAVFVAVDTNEDGVIDPDEFKTATEDGGVLAGN